MSDPADPRAIRLANCASAFMAMPPALQASLLRKGVLGTDPAVATLASDLDHNRPGAVEAFIRWLDASHPATGPVPQAWCGEIERAWSLLAKRQATTPAGDLTSLLSGLPTIPGLPSASSVASAAQSSVGQEVSTQTNAALDKFYIGAGVAALTVLAGMGIFAWYATQQQQQPVVVMQQPMTRYPRRR